MHSFTFEKIKIGENEAIVNCILYHDAFYALYDTM